MSDVSMENGAAATAAGPEPIAAVRRPRFSRRLAASVALPAIFLVIVVAFWVLRPETFFTTENLRTILLTQSVPAVFAIAVLLPLVVGEFDLSLGSNLGFALIIATGLQYAFQLPGPLSIAIAIVASGLVGLLNGVLVARLGVNALVATLAVGSLLSGVTLWLTNGAVFHSNIPSTLTSLSSSPGGVPVPFLILAAVAIGAWFFLGHTPTGRYFYALGGSKDAARLAGLNVTRLTIAAFSIAGVLAGIAGVTQAGILGAGNPTVGPQFLLPGFTAAFLGATTISPGVFNVPGTVIAVFTVATGIIGLELVGVPFFVEPVFAGAALLVAIVAARFLHRSE
jgi:ribose transport system permease protein